MLRVHIRSAGYESKRDTIQNIVFSVKSGELVGLIGANGAGKSTTIKAILGLLEFIDADISFGSGDQHGCRYSYIPEQPIIYEGLTLWEHLELAATAYGLEQQKFRQEADGILARFRLDDERNHLPQGFSKGMQQKMMLVISFLIKPDFYIIDEPFIGLDPLAIRDFLDFLEGEKSRGAGILMSTHVLDTAEKICDSFVLVNKGRLAAQGNLNDIRRKCNGSIEASLFDCFLQLVY